MGEVEKKHIDETASMLRDIDNRGKDITERLQLLDASVLEMRGLMDRLKDKVGAVDSKIEAHATASNEREYSNVLWYFFSFFFGASFSVWAAGLAVGSRALQVMGTLSVYPACALLMYILIRTRRRLRTARTEVT